MYRNIGGKLKALATVQAVLGIVASGIYGIVMMMDERFVAGLLIIVIGCISSWIGSWLTYGIGTAVENSESILHHLRKSEDKQKLTGSVSAKKIVTSDVWECPQCLRINPSYVCVCACGKKR